MQSIPRPFSGFYLATISDILLGLSNDLPRFEVAAVRSLDSTHETKSIDRIMRRLGIGSSESLAGAIIAKDELVRALELGTVFCGFDEIWLLETRLPGCAIPSDLSLTTDCGPASAMLLDRVAHLMRELPAAAVLGDGCGLNCITFDEHFWRAVEDNTEKGTFRDW